ncbi:DsrE family protein [Paraneptunicella aestuarii]|nr:DsrE family protein [Paraneptunicella aestuarii]
MKYSALILSSSILFSSATLAGKEAFTSGPVIEGFGENAPVKQTHPVSANQKFKIAFDIADQGDSGAVNRKINSLARFINMQARAGVPVENIQLAMVIHGKAGYDFLNNAAYKAKFGVDNPNSELLKQLVANNVKFYLCGQSAAFLDIKQDMLVDGVDMALSAMTTHALLQQDGYTLNPF